MRWTLTLGLIIGFICLNTNWVESRPDSHDHHSHGSQSHEHHSHEHHHHEHSPDASPNVKIANFAVHLMDDLHHEAKMDENILVSPMSVQILLTCIYKGAAGKTKQELGKYLNIKESESTRALAEEAADLKKVFVKDPLIPSYAEASLAVGIFPKKDLPIRKEYVDDIRENFFTKVENVDFTGKEATDKINKFTSDMTRGRIPKLFTSTIDPSTVMVLVSTLYFHGLWKNDFPAANTKIETFHTGVKEIQVPMMSDKQYVLYHHHHDLQMESIQIPYNDPDYVMGIVLPHKNQTVMELGHHLTGEELVKTFSQATSTAVEYKIPKMKISWSKSLKSILEKEGLKMIFDKPDFSQLSPAGPIKVSDIQHAAEMEVDEKGTVASAATAAKFVSYALVQKPTDGVKFYADRPFMMTIFHKPTSLILFQAFVHQPK